MEQVRQLAREQPRVVELMTGLARDRGIYIAAGSMLTPGEGNGIIHNDSYLFAPNGKVGVQGSST